MASGPIVEGNDGANREKQRYSESKVYKRKAFKGAKKQNTDPTATATTATTATAATVSKTPATADNNASATTTPTTTTTANTTDVAIIDNNKNEDNRVEIDKNEDGGLENDKNVNDGVEIDKHENDGVEIDKNVDSGVEIDKSENDGTESNKNDGTKINVNENGSTKSNRNENAATENNMNECNGTDNNMNEENCTENIRNENESSFSQEQHEDNGTENIMKENKKSFSQEQHKDTRKENEKSFSREQHEDSGKENEKSSSQEQPTQTLTVADTNLAQETVVSHSDAALDDSLSLNRQRGDVVTTTTGEALLGNGVLADKSGDDRVKISVKSSTKQQMREIRKKLESELDTVRSLVKRIEAKEVQISGGVSNSQVFPVSDGVSNGVRRAHSEVASVGMPVSRVGIGRPSRPLNQLSISTVENSLGVSENVEKEKRTPKANQFYRNSEFLLAKDKFPPAESNKKSKLNVKKHAGNELGHGFGTGSKIFKNCSALLEKLMKHKHGWVFNAPVDVKSLGLHDYFTIIRHPMDLGTVKTRLNKNWYKSPKEFAEDVRLTFHNAMTYNPKGQDVHIMAEQLLKIFEDKWVVIESDYNREMRIGADYEMGFHTPISRKAPPLPPPPLDMRRILDRSESMSRSMDPRLKPISTTPSSRTPAPKKPKAKDPHKRDMTYEEKQRLSTNLQSLPSEKLDNIVLIIKKRNSSLFQHDDEIEVDIDSVDAETLWELDRFVTNYKKSLSKNKRKAELAIQARAEAQQNVQQIPAPVVAEVPKEIRTDGRNASSSSPAQLEKQGDNGSRSSSSSSSSSDSGSSSSDSDSDSSSSGSDGGNSPRN